MRIFYRTKTNEVEFIDTNDTPVFLSCRPKEVEFLSQTDDNTDSFFLPKDAGMEEPEVEDFIKKVFQLNEELNYYADEIQIEVEQKE